MDMQETTVKKMSKIIFGILGVVLLLGILLGALFMATGGRFFTVQTPSMATYAPVGTFVLSQPVNFDDIKKDDTILFKPPASEEVYFHRVLAVTDEGLKTKGDLSEAIDPWILTEKDIVGKELTHFVNFGFLLQALPVFLIGAILLYTITHFYMPRYWRFPVRVFGWSMMFSIANYIFHPFVNVSVLSQTIIDGVSTTRFVPTGMWKLEGVAYEGTTATAWPGEVGVVTSSIADSKDYFSVNLGPYMDVWTWIFLVATWCIPVALTLGYAAYARHKGLDLIETVEEQPAQQIS